MVLGLGKVTCGGCGGHYSSREAACPACLVPRGESKLPPVSEGGPSVQVRVYPGQTALIRAKGFQLDAARMARVGWKPGTQSSAFLALTVTYQRD